MRPRIDWQRMALSPFVGNNSMLIQARRSIERCLRNGARPATICPFSKAHHIGLYFTTKSQKLSIQTFEEVCCRQTSSRYMRALWSMPTTTCTVQSPPSDVTAKSEAPYTFMKAGGSPMYGNNHSSLKYVPPSAVGSC